MNFYKFQNERVNNTGDSTLVGGSARLVRYLGAFRITALPSVCHSHTIVFYKHFNFEDFLISINLQDKNDPLIIESSIS